MKKWNSKVNGITEEIKKRKLKVKKKWKIDKFKIETEMKERKLSRTLETRNAFYCVVLPRSIRVSMFHANKQLIPDAWLLSRKTKELLILRTFWLLKVTCLIYLLTLCCSKRNVTSWDSYYLQSTQLFSAETVYINLPVLYTVTHFYSLHFDVTSYSPITRSLFRWRRYAWLPG
jgi:hypothetical protein